MDTASEYFRRHSLGQFHADDYGDPSFDWAGFRMRALVWCGGCGTIEEVSPDAGSLHACSGECHAPRCPCCGRFEYDKADPALARCMVKIEPFRSDRLLPRSDDSSFEHSPPHPSVGVNVLTKLDGFTITRPYHAHTQVTAPPGDFRTGSGPEELGRVFER